MSEVIGFGLDLAKLRDYSALTIGRIVDHVAYIKKLVMWLHTDYSVIMDDVRGFYRQFDATYLELDESAMGEPILEAFKTMGLSVIGKKFTIQSKWDMRNYTRTLFQNKQFILPKSGPHVRELIAELKEQEIIQGAKKVPSMDHPAGRHDDMVWSTCLMLDGGRPYLTEAKWAVRIPPRRVPPQSWMNPQSFR